MHIPLEVMQVHHTGVREPHADRVGTIGGMFYAFGFDRIGVVAADLYFLDPRPAPGQEGAEQGVRLEVRFVEPGPLTGTIYAARPIAIDRPIWRADLLESVENPGSFDRTHHHPKFRAWDPSKRHFVEEMSADPVAWVGKRLADLEGLLDEAGVPLSEIGPTDAQQLRDTVPQITDAVQRLLDGVRAGVLGQPPAETADSARESWL